MPSLNDVLAENHWVNGADITIPMQPIRREDADRFGILKSDQSGQIVDFVEKPKDPEHLNAFVSRDDEARPYLGSMGIYMFNMQALVDILESTTSDDFGGEVIPQAIGSRDVYGFEFEGYWEDIGTIRSFYETNISLTRRDSPFNFHDPDDPIYTHPRFLPGSVIDGASLHNVLMADGCRIGKAEIRDTVVGLRSQIADGARLREMVIMGADYYDTPETIAQAGGTPVGIGSDCDIECAIIDKNVRAGEGVVIRRFPRDTEIDREDWVVRDGVVVVPKDTVLPAGTYIGPE